MKLESEANAVSLFRAEKRNKHSQVLAALLAPSMKEMIGSTNFTCCPNFHGKQQHFHVTNGKLSIVRVQNEFRGSGERA